MIGCVFMSKLTLIIDNWGHKELLEYLMSLDGILDVKISNEKYLKINVKYDPKLLNSLMIRMEIFFFLDILKIPSLIGFDKHFSGDTLKYSIIKKDICCEYCLKGAIDDLFIINGIEKVMVNYDENDYVEGKDIIININFNPQVISVADTRQIELNLNL